MIELKNKKVIVIGLARTGASVARFCRGQGAQVLVLERSLKPADPIQAASLLSMGVDIRFGSHDPQVLDGADLVIPSPGVPPATPILREALETGVPVISEIELASALTTRSIIAVTGTNGKTTTTSLIGEIFRAAGKAADVCGNIGRPMIDFLGQDRSSDALLVVEVSSFQLEFVDQFKPKIGVLLNIEPDHLDWHEDVRAYRAAKMKMFRRQTAQDWAVVGTDIISLVEDSRARKLIFDAGDSSGSLKNEGTASVTIADGWIVHNLHGQRPSDRVSRIMPVSQLTLRGEHNLANAMAASGVALIEGIDEKTIARALREFKGVEHRLEHIMQDNGVLYYNDSKATNPAAAITALKAFDEAIIMVAGGRNKGNSFEELAKEASGRVKLAVLFGESAQDIGAALAKHSVPLAYVASLDEAVHEAAGAAVSGDVVLLAPACASFDMFTDYEDRGRVFKAAVRAEVGSIGAR